MKALIHKSTGEWVQLSEHEVWTSNIPQLFPNTFTLEGLKALSPAIEIDKLEVAEVFIVKKEDLFG